jgi:hypothetical protein
MGLDMYAYTTALELSAVVDFPEPEDAQQLHYWRKHPNLHGWMEGLYRTKGGGSDDFNCDVVVLDSDDLDQLEEALTGRELPDTMGCFFGESDGSELPDDLSFVAKARAAIRDGKTIYYKSWW